MGNNLPMEANPRPKPVERIPRAIPLLFTANQRWTNVMIGVHMAAAPMPTIPKNKEACQKEADVPMSKVPIPRTIPNIGMIFLAPSRSVRLPANRERMI